MLSFDGWEALLRTAIVGTLAYIALVVMLRFSGKRMLSKMNAFDFVVTIALGSILATVMLSNATTLAQGITAFGVLMGLQFAVTWSSVRLPWMRKWVTGEPQMLLYDGQFLDAALRASRVTESEVMAAIRSAGLSGQAFALAVVLETDASLSVVARNPGHDESSLVDVRGAAKPA